MAFALWVAYVHREMPLAWLGRLVDFPNCFYLRVELGGLPSLNHIYDQCPTLTDQCEMTTRCETPTGESGWSPRPTGCEERDLGRSIE